MNINIRQPVRIVRCPYLGLQDDDSTSLAYASPWNICYHAAPPAPVLVSHQAEVCLCPQYVGCPVLLSNQWRRFPRNLRGKAGASLNKNSSSTRLAWLIVFVLLGVILIVILSLHPPFLL